ncbi:MAG: TolC family protein [Candidatus Omnitrophota bacterium]
MKTYTIKIAAAIAAVAFISGQCVSPALAESEGGRPSTSLGLNETVTRALATNEGLKIKDSETLKSREVYKEARSGLLPHISAQSSWTNYQDYPASDDAKADYMLSGGIAVSQLLWSFGKVTFAVSSSKRAAEALAYSREAGKNDVVYVAKLNYYSALLAKNSLMISQESYNNARDNKKLLEDRSAGGRSSKYEILKVDADVASRVPSVNEARAQYVTAMETLKSLIEARPEEEFDLTDVFKPEYADLDYNVLEAALLGREPGLKSLGKAFEASQAAVNNKRAGFLPTLSAFANLDKSGKSNEATIPSRGSLSDYASIGLKVSVPLWEGGATKAQLGQALAERTAAQLRKDQARKALLLELKKAFVEYLQYKDNLAANTEAVRLAGESFKQMQEMFTSGQVTLTDLNAAELLLTNQKINKEMTLFNVNVTLAKIEQLIAGEYNGSETSKQI